MGQGTGSILNTAIWEEVPITVIRDLSKIQVIGRERMERLCFMF